MLHFMFDFLLIDISNIFHKSPLYFKIKSINKVNMICFICKRIFAPDCKHKPYSVICPDCILKVGKRWSSG